MFRTLSRGQLAFDIVAPTGLFVLLFAPYFSSFTNLPVLVGMCATLVFWRLNAGISLGIAWATAIVQMVLGVQPDPANLAIFVALYATSAYGSRAVKWAGFASAIVGPAVITAYVTVFPYLTDPPALSSFVAGPDFIRAISVVFFPFLALFLLAWTLGLLAKTYGRARESRAAQADAEVERLRARQDVVVEQERNRIARDMHDIVAHSLAVVIAQSDGARYARATDPRAVDDALTAISSTAREALSDVRVLLGQLRHSQGEVPQPLLDDLPRLLDQVRASGVGIDFEVLGKQGPLGTAQQLAVYRIVQEALTNALRHGDTAEKVTVSISWATETLSLTVSSALDREPPTPLPSGHGLAGMNERATLVGGSFHAGPSDGRFVVDARIPRVGGQTGAQPTVLNAATSLNAQTVPSRPIPFTDLEATP